MKIIITETVKFVYDVPDPTRLSEIDLPTTARELIEHDADELANALEAQLGFPKLRRIAPLTGFSVLERDVRAEYVTPATASPGVAA